MNRNRLPIPTRSAHWRYVRCKGDPTDVLSKAVLAIHDKQQLFRILSGDRWLYRCWQVRQPLYVQLTRDTIRLAQITVFPIGERGLGQFAWLPKI